MKKKNLYINIIFFITLSAFSIGINIHYGNIGVFPLDNFAFFYLMSYKDKRSEVHIGDVLEINSTISIDSSNRII